MSGEEILRFPLLHDHHSHVSLYASFEGLPDLGGLDRQTSIELLESLPRDRLNLVKGWRNDRLSDAATELAEFPALLLVNSSLHGFAFSPAALPFLQELWPEFAQNAGDPGWGERNLPRLFAFYGRLAGLDPSKLTRFMTRMEELGIGSLEDMALTDGEALAIVSASPYAERIAFWASPEVYLGLPRESRLLCAGVKLFLDGSLGARSAALDAPFIDGSEGALLYDDVELSRLLAELASNQVSLSAHALGHRAIAQILACLEALGRDGVVFPSIRLEHAQFISGSQASSCKKAGITLSMQPNFNSDSLDYADRLIPRHRAENDPFRMLIDEAGFVPGVDLLFGSDGMPHGPEFALRWSLFPDNGTQRLSSVELEAGYGLARGIAGQGGVFVVDRERRSVRRMALR